MANKKISQLDRVTTHTADDLVAVVNNGFTQKTTLYDLDRWFLGSSCEGDILISGNLIAGCLNTGEGSFYSILGGKHNRISGQFSHIGGGENNVISGHAYDASYDDPNWSYIAGGKNHTLQGDQSFIGGGDSNKIFPGVKRSSILAGTANQIRKDSDVSTIAGGNSNIIGGGDSNSILGGGNHFISGAGGTIVGGDGNKIQAQDLSKQVYGFIGGGYSNLVSGDNSDYSIILGGYNSDIIEAKYSAILGGYENLITTGFANVVGGYKNKVTGHYNTVFGRDNNMSGQYMFGFGRNLQTVPSGNGQVMFSDSFSQPTKSFAQNSMTLDFASGVHLINGDLYVHDMMGKSAIQSNDKYLAYNVEEGIVYTVDTDLAGGGGGSGPTGPIGPTGPQGPAGPAGSSGTSGAPDLSSITDNSVLYDNGGTIGGQGSISIEAAGPYYGLVLDGSRIIENADADLNVNVSPYDVLKGDPQPDQKDPDYESFEIDSRQRNIYTIRLSDEVAIGATFNVNITHLQQGQEFTLVLYSQNGASGNHMAFTLYFDGVDPVLNTLRDQHEAEDQDVYTGIKLLSKVKHDDTQLAMFPTGISGKSAMVINMRRVPLYTGVDAIVWDSNTYGDPEQQGNTFPSISETYA